MARDALPWGSQWDLVRAGDDRIRWSDFLVTFGLQEGRAGGKAPVNRYFGTLTEDADGRLTLGPMATTMMAGSPAAMAAETVYLGLLGAVVGYRCDDDQLVLTDAAGAELLVFEPSRDPS